MKEDIPKGEKAGLERFKKPSKTEKTKFVDQDRLDETIERVLVGGERQNRQNKKFINVKVRSIGGGCCKRI